MWIPRVKIRLLYGENNQYYKTNKWVFLCKYRHRNLYYKYNTENTIEFVIDGYKNKKIALKRGKELYFKILISAYRSIFKYELGDSSYITRFHHEDDEKDFKTFMKNEEWFYNIKTNYANFKGLGIYEAESISDLKYYNEDEIELEEEYEKSKKLDIFHLIKNNTFNCLYNKKAQNIFHLFNMVEYAECNIKILLLCQILEIMCSEKNRSTEICDFIDGCTDDLYKLNISEGERNSLIAGFNRMKKESKGKNISDLICKYSKNKHYDFNKYKLFRDCYRLRGKITHGDDLSKEDIYINAIYLKELVLDIFEQWSINN